MKRGQCGECTWFDNEHESLSLIKLIPGKYIVGYCRKRFPVVYAASGAYWSGWPLVDTKDGCGEYRLKEEG
jgi:hypothetical protein